MTNLQKRARQWRTFRKVHFLTQARLAEILGVCRKTVDRVERAQRNAGPTTLHKFDTLRRRYESEHQFAGVDWRGDEPQRRLNGADVENNRPSVTCRPTTAGLSIDGEQS